MVYGMTLPDAVKWLQERPGYLAVHPDGRCLSLSRTGFLMRADKGPGVYFRPTSGDLLAITWEVFTPGQLEEAAAKLELEAKAQMGANAQNG